jgi:hypothetical protein
MVALSQLQILQITEIIQAYVIQCVCVCVTIDKEEGSKLD